MPLDVTLPELRARASFLMHGTRNYAQLSAEEKQNIDSAVDSGLRRFYFPEQAGDAFGHQWSFFVVDFELPLEEGKAAYETPDDFGGIVDDLHYASEDNAYIPVRKVGTALIKQRQARNVAFSSFPQIFAEQAQASGGTEPQRYEILLWPAPDGPYTLRGFMAVNPRSLSEEHPVPYGGPAHAETILEAVLAVAEEEVDGQPGNHMQSFLRRLGASIKFDKARHQQEFFGRNGDRSRYGGLPYRDRFGRFHNSHLVTYGGQLFEGDG